MLSSLLSLRSMSWRLTVALTLSAVIAALMLVALADYGAHQRLAGYRHVASILEDTPSDDETPTSFVIYPRPPARIRLSTLGSLGVASPPVFPPP